MVAPIGFMGLSVAFGSGATTGGAAGSFFGPITLVGGVVIGGLAGVIVYSCQSSNTFEYTLQFDSDAISHHLKNENHNNASRNGPSVGIPGNSSPEDPEDDKNKRMNSKEAECEASKLGFEKKQIIIHKASQCLRVVIDILLLIKLLIMAVFGKWQIL